MPAVPSDLDDLEHQALDLLEDLDGSNEPGEANADTSEAVERVRVAFDRLLIGEADRLLAAAQTLAQAEPSRGIDPDALVQVRAAIATNPRLAPALAPAVELIGLSLGLARDRLAWTLLIERSEVAAVDAPTSFAALSTELAVILRDAWPQPDAAPPSRAMRVFRLSALAGAGPSIRARAIAAEHPEQLRLAQALLVAQPEASPSELLDAFEAARVALESTTIDEAPAQTTDGPKRRFTWLHALLAAIVLGLTLWHYLGR